MVDSPSLCVIYNPRAAGGATGSRWRLFQRLLKLHAEFRPTSQGGQACDLARQAAEEGFPTVVASGGDGTVHEVANGLLHAKRRAALGIIPLGSGNDYAKMVGTPTKAQDLIARLTSTHTWEVDVGEVQDQNQRQRYFINSLGLGLSGAVTWEATQIKRRGWGLRGLPLYGLAAVEAIRKAFHSIPTQLTFDGISIDSHILYMAIALGRCEGGGFIIAPDARLDDGWFDYLQATKLSRLRALSYVPRLAIGALPESNEEIRRGQCRTMEVRAAQPLFSHTDGEQFATPADGICELKVRLLTRALTIRGSAPPLEMSDSKIE